jgi:dihydrofolate synthase/folylpolyglutamate synthase
MSPVGLISDYASALDFLFHRINYERTLSVPYGTGEFKLDRMRRLLSLIGDPHLAVKAVHIAGTKGKGSTAAMLAAVFQQAGFRTGLYTSPHIERIEERIAVARQPCSEQEFAALAAAVQPAVSQVEAESAAEGISGPTFFEVTTAMAFLHFAQVNVDIAVLEVGLGGRLDSTNVCQPEVCVITSISFDHTKQLGNTLAAIAGEKAGIIKPGVPVVSGVLLAEPRDVIAARAAEVSAPLIQRGVDFDFQALDDGQIAFHYREPADHPGYELSDLQLKMLGRHQAANAAAAIAAINQLRQRGWSIDDDAIRRGLAAANCPARIELVARQPDVILDVAHNPASIDALLAVLREQHSHTRRILIFASSKDKDYAQMLERLVPAFDVIFLTQYVNNPRAMEPEGLLRIAQHLRRERESTGHPAPALHLTAKPAEAWRLTKLLAQQGDLICIAGSFFLAAELRPLIAAL